MHLCIDYYLPLHHLQAGRISRNGNLVCLTRLLTVVVVALIANTQGGCVCGGQARQELPFV